MDWELIERAVSSLSRGVGVTLTLASTITVLEITGYAKRLMSQTYAIFEIFAIAGVFYLVLNTVLILVLRQIENRLTRYQAGSR